VHPAHYFVPMCQNEQYNIDKSLYAATIVNNNILYTSKKTKHYIIYYIRMRYTILLLCINAKLISFGLVYFALRCATGHGRPNSVEVDQSWIIRSILHILYIYIILCAHCVRIVPAYTSFSFSSPWKRKKEHRLFKVWIG
jgi:hypothetical protein